MRNISKENNNFKSLIRKKKTKWPTERGFDEESWHKTWLLSSDNRDTDKSLYDAGIIFNLLLNELRAQISALNETPPNVTISQLLQAYCGMASRDLAIIAKHDVNQQFDLMAATNSSNKLNNELSLQEITENCVEAIGCAIRANIKNISEIQSASLKTDALIYMQKELLLSQLYGMLEDYWRALVWGEYQFNMIDKSNNIYEVQQIASNLTISHEASQMRKMKNDAHSLKLLMQKEILSVLRNDGYLYLKRVGKKKKLFANAVGRLDQKYQLINAQLKLQVSYLKDNFPNNLLESDYDNHGFSIHDVIEVFRVLVILSQITLNTFPQNNGVFSFKKATEFSPKINHIELVRGVSNVTGFNLDKSSKIISFLTFSGNHNDDLWCYPIINLGNKEVTFLIAALATPIMQRVIEHWLVKIKLDLASKGFSYEKTVLDAINSELKENTKFHDYDPAVSYKFKLGKVRDEEIDLILRFGRIVIIGEVKSIVTTDSAISLYRTHEIILSAADQAKRKKQFVSDNAEEVFHKLGWNYDNELDYEFLSLIINSNSICVGNIVNEVPVCDLRILIKYFSSNIVPLLSMDMDENKHLAWFEVYKNFDEAQINISRYLNNPPQISLTRDDFHFKTFRLPMINDNLPKIQITRLVKKEANINELVSKKFSFPISFSSDFHEQTKKIDFLI